MKIKNISKRKPNENFEIVFKMYQGNERAGLYISRVIAPQSHLPTATHIHSILNDAIGNFRIKYYKQRHSKIIKTLNGQEVFVRSIRLEKEEDIFLFLLSNIPIWKIYKLA